MGAARYTIRIEQGATWRTTLTLANTDLTGYSARMQARADIAETTTLLDLSTGSGITIDGTAGRIVLELTDEQTTVLDWTEGVYDLEIIAPNGDVTRLLKGPIYVDPEVTR